MLGNTPDHSFELLDHVSSAIQPGDWRGVQYVGDRRNNNTDTARLAPDFWLFDAMAAYHINDHFSLQSECLQPGG